MWNCIQTWTLELRMTNCENDKKTNIWKDNLSIVQIVSPLRENNETVVISNVQ